MTVNSASTGSNPVLAAIAERRSVREGMSSRPIPIGELAQVLTAGLHAPSSKAAQPWRLHTVTDRDLLDGIVRAVRSSAGIDEFVPHDPATGRPYPHWESTVLESAAVLESAGAAILVENRGVFSRGRDFLLGRDRPTLAGSIFAFELELLGIGGCIQNMQLAAQSIGLGSAYMGDIAIAHEQIGELLGIEGDVLGAMALGYFEHTKGRSRSDVDVAANELVIWHDGRQG